MFITICTNNLFQNIWCDWFFVGIWNSVGDSTDDGEISALKRKLPEYCLASRGLNTKTVYQNAFISLTAPATMQSTFY
jgi:hypothetical protein